MRIFVSYSSQDRELADAIRLALKGAGHEVFFDREDLPAGESYDVRILEAIEASDLLVYLVSPESVADGAYARTELGFARKRWRNPGGRIIPVVVRSVPVDALPAYLRAVTLLEPEGDVAAEVVEAVDALGGWRRFKRTAGLAAIIAVLVLGVGAVIHSSMIVAQAECSLAAASAANLADRMLDALREARSVENITQAQLDSVASRRAQYFRQGLEEPVDLSFEESDLYFALSELASSNDRRLKELAGQAAENSEALWSSCDAETGSPSSADWRGLIGAERFDRSRLEELAAELREAVARYSRDQPGSPNGDTQH